MKCGLIIQRHSNVYQLRGENISHTVIHNNDCWVIIRCARKKKLEPVTQKCLSGCVYYRFWEFGVMVICIFPGRSKMDAWFREYKTCLLSINSGKSLVQWLKIDSVFETRDISFFVRHFFWKEVIVYRFCEIFVCCKVNVLLTVNCSTSVLWNQRDVLCIHFIRN
jgi:hypothetical protein